MSLQALVRLHTGVTTVFKEFNRMRRYGGLVVHEQANAISESKRLRTKPVPSDARPHAPFSSHEHGKPPGRFFAKRACRR